MLETPGAAKGSIVHMATWWVDGTSRNQEPGTRKQEAGTRNQEAKASNDLPILPPHSYVPPANKLLDNSAGHSTLPDRFRYRLFPDEGLFRQPVEVAHAGDP